MNKYVINQYKGQVIRYVVTAGLCIGALVGMVKGWDKLDHALSNAKIVVNNQTIDNAVVFFQENWRMPGKTPIFDGGDHLVLKYQDGTTYDFVDSHGGEDGRTERYRNVPQSNGKTNIFWKDPVTLEKKTYLTMIDKAIVKQPGKPDKEYKLIGLNPQDYHNDGYVQTFIDLDQVYQSWLPKVRGVIQAAEERYVVPESHKAVTATPELERQIPAFTPTP